MSGLPTCCPCFAACIFCRIHLGVCEIVQVSWAISMREGGGSIFLLRGLFLLSQPPGYQLCLSGKLRALIEPQPLGSSHPSWTLCKLGGPWGLGKPSTGRRVFIV